MNFDSPGPDPHNPLPDTGKIHLDKAVLPEIDRREHIVAMDRKQIVHDFLARTNAFSGGDPNQLKSGELLLDAARCKMPDIRDPYWWPDQFYIQPGTAEILSDPRRSDLFPGQLQLVAGYRNVNGNYITHHIDPWGRERWSEHLNGSALMELTLKLGDKESSFETSSRPIFSVKQAEIEHMRLRSAEAQKRWTSGNFEEGSFLFSTILRGIFNNPSIGISAIDREAVSVTPCIPGDSWREPRQFLVSVAKCIELIVTVGFEQSTFHAISMAEQSSSPLLNPPVSWNGPWVRFDPWKEPPDLYDPFRGTR